MVLASFIFGGAIMAAYAATVTISGRKAWRSGVSGFSVLRGTVDITNYNTTLATITGISGKFIDNPTVILNSISTNGICGNWVPVSKSIKAWFPTQQTGSVGNRAAIECATDTNVGAFQFIAIGLV